MSFLGLAGRPPSDDQLNFSVRCVCGAEIRGRRAPAYQFVFCPDCSRRRFVLPASPLPIPTETGNSPEASSRPHRRFSNRRLAIGLVVVLLIAVVATGIAIRSSPRSTPESVDANPPLWTGHRDRGLAAFQGQQYTVAARELGNALALIDEQTSDIPNTELRSLKQLHAQAAVVADLLVEGPEEFVRSISGATPEETEAVWQKRYYDRSMILDDTLHRDAAGVIRHSIRLNDGDTPIRFDLNSLEILGEVPLATSQRVVFGFRLAAVKRGAVECLVTVEPKSGVLLTDPLVLQRIGLKPDDVDGVMTRQKVWRDRLP